ncbi:MAG: SusC/RagA family TonB-linked outer membrane protein [Sphingobacteriia bacterium]|nr:MAG: SusC/RagA family TonB-linked outer membrane protein [Sphingobacteriia bacterium]
MRKKLLMSFCAFLFVLTTGSAQITTITGKVVDDKGNPLAGASIFEKGTKNATSADANGMFSIKVKSGVTLLVSEIGYESQMVVASATNLLIKMITDTKSLSEVVVTGVGVATSKKKTAVSVESVNVANQVKVPTGDVGQQLVGQIAGAQISSTNGNPGQPLNILLRGINTLQGGTLPMILIDGIESRATDLNSIDVNIIERVEVVQGAAAASLYGAQGANGVIQLFTKKAKSGKINIDFTSSVTSASLLNIGNVRKADKHAFATNANNEVISSGGVPLTQNPNNLVYSANVQYNATDPLSFANKAYDRNLQLYDAYAMFFQNSTTLNNGVTISGNKDKMNFLLSASNNQANSPFKGNGDYSRSNLFSKLQFELAKGLTLTSSTQLIYTKNTLNDQDGRGIVYALNNARPFANFDLKDIDGNYGSYYGDAVGVNHGNPNFINQYSSTNIPSVDVIQNLTLNYKFARFVELDAKYGVNFQNTNTIYRYENQERNKNLITAGKRYSTWGSTGGEPATLANSGEILNYNNKTTFQNFIATATIRTDFEKDFKLKIPIKTSTQLSYDYRKNLFKDFRSLAKDAPSFTPWNANQAAVYQITRDYTEPFITYGFLVNQRFEYGDIAGVSVGVRSDFSSAFGSGQTAQTFPRGDVYLNIDKFNFWQNAGISKTINAFKIRAAYGEAGIQPRAFQRFPVLGAANLGTNSVFTFPTNNPNPALQVEISKEFEIGTDIGLNLLNGSWLRSANLSFTYWKRSTDNSIYNVDAAPSTGVGTVVDNAFGLGSNGIQASLNLNILSKKDFTWDLTTNFTKQTSEITNTNGAEIVVTSAAGSSSYVLKAGDKVGQLFGFLMIKDLNAINPATGLQAIPDAQKGLYTVASNGWVVNKTTKLPYNIPGQFALGDPNPAFNMSFINNLSYKGYLQFSMQWDWVNGSHIYNQTKSWMYRDGISSDYANPITIDGTTQAYTAFYRGVYQAGANNGTKNYFYEDASFWRLRNVSLAFDFARAFKMKYFTKLQLVVSGRNLVTFTKYTGMDPEVSSGTSNSAFDRGVDHNTIPNTKAYTIGLNFGF